jgi:uncharacterized protein YxjI
MPVTYKVKQHWNQVRIGFTITEDGSKDTLFTVKGEEIDKWGMEYSFRQGDTELASMKRRTEFRGLTLANIRGSMKPKFTILRNGGIWAELNTDKLGWRGTELTLDIPGPNDYKIMGNRTGWKWTIHRTADGTPLAATINKKVRLTDTYLVTVEDDEDAVAMLLLAIMIDQIFHESSGSD